MRVEVFCNPNTFHVLSAVGCPEEYKASNGWIVHSRNWQYPISSKTNEKSICLNPGEFFLASGEWDEREVILTALHEMVYQPQPVFSDDGQTVTMEHGKFWICERPGGQVCFQVLEMDEEFRCKGGLMRHEVGNGWFVDSIEFPTLEFNRILLRGINTSKDLFVNCGYSAGITRTQIIEALRDWDRNWPGWTRTVPTLAECCRYGSVDGGGLFVFDSEVGNG